MNFIKKIFDDKIDEDVHRQFIRYGKGVFKDKAIAEMSIGKNVKIKTSFEYANEFVRCLANTIKDKIHVSGGIITIKDIRGIGFEIKDVKQFAGVKTYLVDTELFKDDLINAIEKFPDALYCLSFSTGYGSLKIKVKSPRSGKHGKDDEEAKADYCSLVTKDLEFKNEFAFDIEKDFKRFRASHIFEISELIVPDEYKNDFSKARLFAKRKAKIIRITDVDGVKEKTVKEVVV